MPLKTDDLLPRERDSQLEYELLRTLIDHLPHPVYIKDTQCRFVVANQAMANVCACSSPSELIGRNDFDFFSPAIAQEYFDDEQRLLATGEPILSKEESVPTHKSGAEVFLVSKTPIHDDKGEIIGLAGIGHNVTKNATAIRELDQQTTALKEKNEQIEIERRQLKTLIDNIPDYIYFKDTDSRYRNGNDKFHLGLNAPTLEEIIGKSDFDFFEKDVAQQFLDDETEMFRSGKTVSKEEHFVGADGQPKFFHTTKTPIFENGGKNIIGMVGISRDITEIKEAREALMAQADDLRVQKEELNAALEQLKGAQSQLVQSEKMASLGVLTAGIAHEINNPMNFVYVGVNSMEKDFKDVKSVVAKLQSLAKVDDPAQAVNELEALRAETDFDEAFEAMEETLKDIKLGATRITEIVSGLSKFSRLGQTDWEVTNIHDDIETVLVLLKNKYKHHIEIERDFDSQIPAVECFPGKLNQAIMNIISNAIDAIDAIDQENRKNGKIKIASRFDEQSVFISINDNGVGMDEAVRSKVFDPFFTTKGIGKGTGLGLSITYSIIQDHGGTLHLTTNPGEGSTFVIEIPLRHSQI